MGTRSRIGVMHGDIVKSVYCHWDGYLDNNGRILQEHFDSVKANQLVSLGDLSFLDQVHSNGGEYYYIMKDGVWYAGAIYATTGLIKEGLVRLDEALAALSTVEEECAS
jgi:hypothetical protein